MAAIANRVFAVSTTFSVVGIVLLTITAFLAFEQPNNMLLIVSSLLVFTAPFAVLVHLAISKELTVVWHT